MLAINDCVDMYKYVDLKVSAAMVVNNNYAGVTSEVNLRNPLHVGNKVPKQGIYPDFLKPEADVSRGQKQGYHWPHKKC